jgi:hypothetical protein
VPQLRLTVTPAPVGATNLETDVPKFRKKAAVVEAVQFGGFYHTPYPPGVKMEDNGNDPSKERYRFYVVTARGLRAYLDDGDWVIANPDGRSYQACKPDVFAATYEPVEHNPPAGGNDSPVSPLGVNAMAKKKTTHAEEADAELTACEEQLEELQSQLTAPRSGDGTGTDAGLDPATVLTLIQVVMKLIAWLKNR